ncbi:MAG: cytochrome c biogenesis protein CcsA [Helicobacter sp.]|nr:cytochrome c biogenesis protein CcsA [Helicobacter sp.]
MKIFDKIFANFYVILPLIFVYVASIGVATFIENDFGTPVANELIYRSAWFNALHVYFFFAIIFSMVKTLPKRNYSSLVFHLSFCIMILGAGITRFFSQEGIMHIKEGESSYQMTASDPTLNIVGFIFDDKKSENYYLKVPIRGKMNNESIDFFNKPLDLTNFKIKHSEFKKDDSLEITFDATYDGITKSYKIKGSRDAKLQFTKQDFNGIQFFIGYGNRQVILPFGLKLNDFQLERYPGSLSPSAYLSDVEVVDLDGKSLFETQIFMNNVLDYRGYRFYQSSYDEDEKGTILSVNKDPGKNVTYTGYALLILGSIWMLFNKNGRVIKLSKFLQSNSGIAKNKQDKQKKQNQITKISKVFLGLFMPFLLSFAHADESIFKSTPNDDVPSLGNGLTLDQSTLGQSNESADLSSIQTVKKQIEFLKIFAQRSKQSSKIFSKIQIQNYLGRIEPINSTADNLIKKLSHKQSILGMDGNQLFLGMMFFPDIFSELKIIYINDNKINKILGLKKDDKYASFSDFFNSNKRGYKLNNFIQEANRLDPKKRNEFQKNIIKVDERINLVYSVFSGLILKIFPINNDLNWLSPPVIYKTQNVETVDMVSNFLNDLNRSLEEGLKTNNFTEFNSAVNRLQNFQEQNGKSLYLDSSKIKAEIFLIDNNFFQYLVLPYILLGLLFFGIILYYLARDRAMPKQLFYGIYIVMVALVLIHTIGLILRWYVSNHSPFSNAYESMVYIAWASAVSGVVFLRKYTFALSAAVFLAGISLFVANLGFMDPQISPLVPVLKSYWLNIHVSIITASYGFLGLSFILGFFSLLLFLLRKDSKPQIDKSIQAIYALNELSMIFGILMLSVGNFLGGIWANESWGRYWSWDPKETWALASIGVYALILHLRLAGIKNMPYIFSVSSILGFFSILMTYFGVNYYLTGLHSYAAGDPIPIPVFFYYFVGFIILLIALSFPKRKLLSPNLTCLKN